MQTEDYCPGTTDFRMVREKKGVFEGIDEDIEIIGFINCGGCPAKKAVLRARELVRRGADTIVFASCIQKGTPIGCPCLSVRNTIPHAITSTTTVRTAVARFDCTPLIPILANTEVNAANTAEPNANTAHIFHLRKTV